MRKERLTLLSVKSLRSETFPLTLWQPTRAAGADFIEGCTSSKKQIV